MLNKRLDAATRVADALIKSEVNVDDAILHASRLSIAVIVGRRSAKLPLNAGQEGLELVSRAAKKLIDARADIIAAHIAFRETQREIGLDALSFGDIYESPKIAQAADAGDGPKPYVGPRPIRDHRNLEEVSRQENEMRLAEVPLVRKV